MKDFLRHGALVFVGLVTANVLTYIYYAIVVRSVGVEAAGLFTSLVSAMLIASVPAFVVGTIVTKIAAEAQGRGEIGVLRSLGTGSSLVLLPLAVVSGLAATAGAAVLGGFFHVVDPLLIVLAAAGFALTFALALQRAVLQGSNSFGKYALSYAIEGVGKAAAGVACWFSLGGLRVALGGYVAATALAFGLNARMLLTRGAAAARPHLPRAVVLRHVTGIALPIAAITAITFSDTVLVRHYLDARASGLYGATALVGRALVTVMQFIPTVLMPKAAAEHALGRSPVRPLIASSVVALAVASALVVLVAAFPVLVVTAVAGRAFAAAAPLVLPYTCGMAALAGATIFSAYLIGIDRLGFVGPLSIAAVAELVAIVLRHPDAQTVVWIVVAGHSAVFVCCLVDTIASLRAPRTGESSVSRVERADA